MARAAKAKDTQVSLETVLWNCRVALRGVGSTERTEMRLLDWYSICRR